jgi:hypothetical protein
VVGLLDLADSSFDNLLRRHQGDRSPSLVDEFDDALKRAHAVFFVSFWISRWTAGAPDDRCPVTVGRCGRKKPATNLRPGTTLRSEARRSAR